MYICKKLKTNSKKKKKKKNLLAIAIIGIALVSCKKDLTCECVNTEVSRISTQPGFTYSPKPSTKTTTKYKGIKKRRDLAQNCVSYETTYTQNVTGTVLSGTTLATVNYVETTVQKSECELK